MTIAIRAEGVSKKYRISHRKNENDTLRDELAELVRGIGRHDAAGKTEEFWALRDLSFEIRQGDRVGLIGRNGAGKSTLLKILSRITEPSAGCLTLRGRVASLLEVGTGFHPELSGRENIYLNGAILGMRRSEIRRKFDEIVDFAEVEKFLDTPVKRYSSGMYVRLAFAVAAHLEPEILIVDEVLAVGDAAFQKKCLARMNKAGEAGVTVLFVSHNISAIQGLCNRAMLLHDGCLQSQGEVAPVIRQYLENSRQLAQISLAERADRKGSGQLRFTSVSLEDGEGRAVSALHSGQHARLLFKFSTSSPELKNVLFAVGVDNDAGDRVAYFCNELVELSPLVVPESVRCFEVEIEKLPLMAGQYRLTIYCSVNGQAADWIQNAGVLEVEPGDFYGTGRMHAPATQGQFLIEHRFHQRRG